MARQVRQMIKIDEEKCNGCGLCVTGCAEGALQVVDGKAKLVSETYCDGLGACIGECPQDAITFESREADNFDEAATIDHLMKSGRSVQAHLDHMAAHADGGGHEGHSHGHAGHVCPSAKTIDRTKDAACRESASTGEVPSELRQWPLKLYLVNPSASFFEDADLLLAADCVPFAFGGFHPEMLRGKTLVAGCPKFDDTELYLEKLTNILSLHNVKSITVAQMEVPCCSGMTRLAQAAVQASGKQVPVQTITIGLDGELM